MMSFVIVGGVTGLVGLVALFASDTFGIGALLISALFGSASAVALPGIGGIQPTHALLGILLARSMLSQHRRRAFFRSAAGPAAFWLLLTFVIAAAGAVLLPALFKDQLLVYPIRGEDLASGIAELPLSPTPGNITQTVYFAGDVACFLLVSAYIKTERQIVTIASLFLAYCIANLVFGFADFVTAKTGTSAALEFMRNASYTIFDDVGSGDLQRVKGSFTEASAFAYATTGCFVFATRLWIEGVRPKTSILVSFLSLAFLLLSTSSTAYVSAAACIICLYGGSLLRAARGSQARNDATFIFCCPIAVIAIILVVLVTPSLSESLRDVLDTVIFDKSASQSGIERAAMNAAGMRAFIETYGLGVGIGSTRASSFVIAAISSLGIIGSLTYGAFLLAPIFTRHAFESPSARKAHAALRCSFMASVGAASLSGALIDLGVAFFVVAAAICATHGLSRAASTTRSNAPLLPRSTKARLLSFGGPRVRSAAFRKVDSALCLIDARS